MDEHYLQTLRQNIILNIRKAEASIYSGDALNFDVVLQHVTILQNYLMQHMPVNPPDSLKEMVYAIFDDLTHLTDRIAAEVNQVKQKVSQLERQEKVNRTYNYGKIE